MSATATAPWSTSTPIGDRTATPTATGAAAEPTLVAAAALVGLVAFG